MCANVRTKDAGQHHPLLRSITRTRDTGVYISEVCTGIWIQRSPIDFRQMQTTAWPQQQNRVVFSDKADRDQQTMKDSGRGGGLVPGLTFHNQYA